MTRHAHTRLAASLADRPQTTIDCWAKMPAIAPCDDAWVTEGRKVVVRSPAALMPGMLVWRRSSTLRAMPTGVSTVARPSDSCRLADGLLRGWANRMSTAILRRVSGLTVVIWPL